MMNDYFQGFLKKEPFMYVILPLHAQYADIYNYLRQGQILYSCQSKFLKIIIKCIAIGYIIINDIIHKRSFYGTFLICLNETKENKAMKQVHDNVNGVHFNGKVVYHKLLRIGYYWSSMEKDCIFHIQKYQKHANLKQAPSSELATITSPWPFPFGPQS